MPISTQTDGARRGGESARAGFTIVELLISIGVIALLLAISLPALRSMKAGAVSTATLAHQRQVGFVLRQYADDRRDAFPYWGIPGTHTTGPLFYFPGGYTINESWYWRQGIDWHIYLWNHGYHDSLATTTGPERGYTPAPTSAALDVLTYTAFADPSFWRDGGAHDVQDLRPQRWSRISHPSRKGVLRRWDIRDGRPGGLISTPDQVLVWFADGHGESRPLDGLRPGATVPAAPLGPPALQRDPVLTTAGGLSGIDT